MSNDNNKKLDALNNCFDIKFNEQNIKLNKMNTSIVKQFNERCDEFIESQKQSIGKIILGKTDRSKCRKNKDVYKRQV